MMAHMLMCQCIFDINYFFHSTLHIILTFFVAFVLTPNQDNVIGLFKDKNNSALWIAPSKNDGFFPYSAFFGQAQSFFYFYCPPGNEAEQNGE